MKVYLLKKRLACLDETLYKKQAPTRQANHEKRFYNYMEQGTMEFLFFVDELHAAFIH